MEELRGEKNKTYEYIESKSGNQDIITITEVSSLFFVGIRRSDQTKAYVVNERLIKELTKEEYPEYYL